jgi:hypothetical protein
MITASATFKQSAGQVSCKINDEVAILNLDRAIYFGLQGVAVEVWDSLAEPRSVADLCAAITAEFDVSAAECEADIVEILKNLQDEGLIETVS